MENIKRGKLLFNTDSINFFNHRDDYYQKKGYEIIDDDVSYGLHFQNRKTKLSLSMPVYDVGKLSEAYQSILNMSLYRDLSRETGANILTDARYYVKGAINIEKQKNRIGSISFWSLFVLLNTGIIAKAIEINSTPIMGVPETLMINSAAVIGIPANIFFLYNRFENNIKSLANSKSIYEGRDSMCDLNLDTDKILELIENPENKCTMYGMKK